MSLEVVEVKYFGTPKLVTVTGTASALTANLRPDQGKQYQVIDAWLSHDDTGQTRAMNWRYYDGTTTLNKIALGIGSGVYVSITRNDISPSPAGPIILTYDNYAMAIADAITAGKHVLIYAKVLEFGT